MKKERKIIKDHKRFCKEVGCKSKDFSIIIRIDDRLVILVCNKCGHERNYIYTKELPEKSQASFNGFFDD